jgi:hypothetical protein
VGINAFIRVGRVSLGCVAIVCVHVLRTDTAKMCTVEVMFTSSFLQTSLFLRSCALSIASCV